MNPTLTQTAPTWQLAAPTAELTSESSLAELRQTRQRWVRQAEELRYFEQLIEIGRELGRRITTRAHGDYHIFTHHDDSLPLSPVVVIYKQRTGRLIRTGGWNSRLGQDTSEWESTEIVNVFLCPGYDIDRRDRSGFPYLDNAAYVCACEISSHPRGNETRFIVPGRWLGSVLSNYPEAQGLFRSAMIDHTETERQALLAELLVGTKL